MTDYDHNIKVHKAELVDNGLVDHVSPSLNMSELSTLLQQHGTQVRLLYSFGEQITVHNKELHYIDRKRRLVVVDCESSYADLVAHVTSICTVSGNFCIKIQLLGEKPDCLIAISSDEDFQNMLAEHDRAIGSSSPARIRSFILQNESSQPSGTMLEAMRTKLNVAEDNTCASVGGFVESNMRHKRWKNRHCRRKKEGQNASLLSNAYPVHKIPVTVKVTRQLPKKMQG